MKTSAEIREEFLHFFEEHGHKRVQSSSLVPEDDPTLLFTNAGMNQFKDVFLGLEKRDYVRAATSQKVMRVSGKHNDLETVGRTPRHHTFFEMLGNFSFGDYFKKGAIEYAWQLLTEVWDLPPDQLRVSVFHKDDDAYELWRTNIGIRPDWIYRLGASENFWSMGETGPCGPCSEVHFDRGTSPAGHADCDPDCDCGRYLEIWNLVFMQFDRDASGTSTPLPSPSIDTGMGLERITSLLQGVQSNYDTDLFRPIIDEAARLSGVAYGREADHDISMRILADHTRACTFLVNDGVVPGNEGRGYVLRKILRRAIRHGKMLGKEEPFLYKLCSLVTDLMGSAYPELFETRDYTTKIVRMEEERFSATLAHGLSLLEELFEKGRDLGQTQLSGSDVFRLYDTYGFPLDLAREISEEQGFSIDEAGFVAEMEQQRERARASWKGGQKALSPAYQELSREGFSTEFTGYADTQEIEGRVLALLQNGSRVEKIREGQQGEVLLSRTPFYAEAGGQVGDQGVIHNESCRARITDTFSPVTGLRLHKLEVQHGELSVGDTVSSSVYPDRRLSTARNHTATHLLHAALRDVLGEHVKQAGSLVAPDRLRFDFSHYQALSQAELRQIEEIVNAKVRENIALTTDLMDLDQALKAGAMALFGEKYQDRVRVVRISDFSLELCGGTHVSRTGDISVFKITSESSISAGVRRVEALTGSAALERFFETDDLVENVAEELRVGRQGVADGVHRLSSEVRDLRKEVEQLQLQLAQQAAGDMLSDTREVEGIRVLSRRVDNLDRSGLRSLAMELRNRLESGVVVLGVPSDGKVSLIAVVSDDLTGRISAPDVIRQIAPIVQGGGGGRPELAEAGGKDPSQLDRAIAETYQAVHRLLHAG